MIKIFVDKNESVASVVEKVIVSPDADIIVVIPRHSELRKSTSNFQLLKRESDTAGKNLLVESVDDEVLALAQGSGIDAMHSLFRRDQFHRSLSDIVPVGTEQDVIPPVSGTRKVAVKNIKRKKAEESEPEASREQETSYDPPPIIPAPSAELPEEKKISPHVWESLAPERVLDREAVPGGEKKKFFSRAFRFPKFVVVICLAVIILFGGVFVLGKFFSRAEIVLDFTKTPWQYDGVFAADEAVGKPDGTKNVLPAEVFSQKKNTVVLFDATGKTSIPQKATGKIIIYNAYGTAPQPLVATTRFRTPDGKIFRLDKGVTVPGAKKDGSNIVPSSIEASITAATSGPAYNVGPVSKLTIPGFEGTPKFDGFYGELKEPTKGGSTGEKAFATDEDITSAKTKTIDVLKSALQTNLLSGIPAEFKILPGASDVQIVKLSVDPTTDANGKFSIFGEAQLRAIGFKETDLKDMLRALVLEQNPNGEFRKIDLVYTQINPDFAKGQVSFAVKADGIVVSSFDVERLKADAAGKSLEALTSQVQGFDGSVKVHLWPPFFTRSVPTDANRVSVVVQ